MKIKTRIIGNGKYIEVILSENGASIDLGMIGEAEAACLIESLEAAVDELGTFVSKLRERAIAFRLKPMNMCKHCKNTLNVWPQEWRCSR